MQAQCVDVCICHYAGGPLPLLEYNRYLIENVRGVLHNFFNILAVQASPMVRTQLHPNFF